MSDPPPRVYLDTNVLIAMVEIGPRLTAAQLDLLGRMDAGQVVGVTSELSLCDVLVKPFADRNAQLNAAYLELLQPGGVLQVVPISRDVLLRAAALRAVTRMKLPGAVHVATAAQTGCAQFVSADRGLRLPETMRQSIWDRLTESPPDASP